MARRLVIAASHLAGRGEAPRAPTAGVTCPASEALISWITKGNGGTIGVSAGANGSLERGAATRVRSPAANPVSARQAPNRDGRRASGFHDPGAGGVFGCRCRGQSAPPPCHSGSREARGNRERDAEGGRAHHHDPALQHEDREPAGRDRGDRNGPGAPRQSDRQQVEPLEVRTAWRRRATGSSGCAASSPTARDGSLPDSSNYKSDAPDALTVVLEADRLRLLLERAEFLDRVSEQDREITEPVWGVS